MKPLRESRSATPRTPGMEPPKPNQGLAKFFRIDIFQFMDPDSSLLRFEIVWDPADELPVQLFGPDGLPDARLTDAARHMTAHVSQNSLPKYLRGTAAMLDAQQRLLDRNPHLEDMWSETALATEMWRDVLISMGLEPKWSSREGCYYMSVADDQFDRCNIGLNGLYVLYQSAMDRKLYAGAENPLACIRKTARSGRRAARAIFRIKREKARALRTQLPAIVERVRRAGRNANRPWPAAVRMLVDVMIEGLARLSEQIRLTLRDWWEASEFGQAISTGNKGDDFARTKEQQISAALAALLRLYVDEERIDRNELEGKTRRTLADFRRLALGGDLAALEREPLFTNAKGEFFSQSGVADYYFKPAMTDAGLDQITSHALRHAGVNAFFAWLKTQPAAEREELKAGFGKYMGWKWPDAMLAHYSEPERRQQAIETAIAFIQARRIDLDAMENVPFIANDDEPVGAHNDSDLDRLAKLEAA